MYAVIIIIIIIIIIINNIIYRSLANNKFKLSVVKRHFVPQMPDR